MAIVWSDERVAMLRELCADPSLSYSGMADKIGGVSRNACIGKAKRLGLVHCNVKPIRLAPYKRKPKPPKPLKPIKAPPTPPVLRPPPTEELGPLMMLPCTLFELDAFSCRWPLDNGMYCGAFPRRGLPYCEHHIRQAYQPARERTSPWPTRRR